MVSLSVLALLVSLASATYAKKAADQAAWSNRVNLHEPRRLIYGALVHYRHLFGEYDLHPTDDEIQNVYISAALPSRLYFPAGIADEIYDIYKASFDLYHRIESAESSIDGESRWEPINEFKSVATSRLDALIPRVIAASELGDT